MIDSFPDVIRIEPAGYCNYHCVNCPVGRLGGKRGLLGYDDFVRIFNSLPIVPRVLVLYHGGEPLLNDRVPDMVQFAKLMGVYRVVIDTNLSLWNQKMDLRGVDELRVAFAGNTPEEHEAIRKGAKFEQDKRNVLKLSESYLRPYRTIVLSIGDGRVSDYLLDAFVGNGCDTGIMFEALIEKKWARPGDHPDRPNKVAYCRNLMTTFTILANGDVPLCNDDLMGDSIHGNVLKDSPLEIWMSMQRVRNAFRRGAYPELCRSCNVVTGEWA